MTGRRLWHVLTIVTTVVLAALSKVIEIIRRHLPRGRPTDLRQVPG